MSDKGRQEEIGFKCEVVNLISSTYCQQLVKEELASPKLDIGIEIDIHEDRFIPKLKIDAEFVTDLDAEKIKHTLSFVLAGFFSITGVWDKTEMINSAKMFSLSILWPYAREYASDVFRRSGYRFPVLPIINAQEVTKQFIENDKINVKDLTK